MYNALWFKTHHFEKLEAAYLELENVHQSIKPGIRYNSEQKKILLKTLDTVIKLHPYLPDTGGGQDSTKALRKKRRNPFFTFFIPSMNYFKAARIKSDIFSIYNYMKSMCERADQLP